MSNNLGECAQNQRCFLCKRAAIITVPGNGDFYVDCERCGKFYFERLLTRTLDEESDELLPYLSISTREASDRREPIRLDSENWEALALASKNIPFSDKVNKLLKLAAERSRLGRSAKFDPHADLPLVYAVDRQQFRSLLNHLEDENYATVADWDLNLKGKAWKELQGKETPQTVDTKRPGGLYVDPSRIEELKSLKNPSFDLSKLIRMCEELNICFAGECYLAVAMLVRSVLDHVPPIFGCNSFAEVGNNYSGGRSFKASMSHLESSSRKIADSHLHQQIRKSESLPNETQVNFANDIDVLLAEVVRILK